MDSLNKTVVRVCILNLLQLHRILISQLSNHPFLSCMAHVYTSKYEVKWLKCFTVANEAQAMLACICLLGGLKV